VHKHRVRDRKYEAALVDGLNLDQIEPQEESTTGIEESKDDDRSVSGSN